MYQVKRPSTSAFVPIRGLNYHVRTWGEPSPKLPPLVLVHGWMDVAASYQFVIDALSHEFVQDRFIVAPDWRGYGKTLSPDQDNYWFADYLADLDFLLDHYAPSQPVDLVGHSMGGNVVMLYAGIRPHRIRRLINLEGFGLPASRPAQAPARYALWMDEIKQLHRGELALTAYDNAEGVARRLMKNNPRLPEGKARWLAQHWAQENSQGQWEILGDAAHKITSAHLYQVQEVLEIYQRISAPVLSVVASENQMDRWWKGKYTLAEYQERLKQVPDVRQSQIDEAGHMLHHDQPEELARQIEQFLA
jgi:pimeloyl-ACP methyl ester carboxylesterase